MNFHKLYQLINENTISQELKKFDKVILKTAVDMADKKMSTQFPSLNVNSKNIFIKWFLFVALKNLNLDKDSRHLTDQEIDRLDLIGPWIEELRGEFGDFIAHNIDDDGNLSAQLASKFNNPAFKIDDLRILDRKYHEALAKGAIVKQGAKGKPILTFNDGYSWVDLEKGYCEKEGRSMGHCGNVNTQPGDSILSLRDRKNIPHLTFIFNNGYLGEMKGKGNSKPSQSYHKYIVELLKLPIIKNIIDGRYLTENDFKLSDLTDEQREEIFNVNPKFKTRYMVEKLKENQNLSKEEFNELESFALSRTGASFSERQKVKASLAKNTNTPGEVLTALFNQSKEDNFDGDDRMILQYIAGNPNTPTKVLKGLAELNSIRIRSELAKNDNTPLEALEILANDVFASIRMYAAMNANVSKELLIKLSKDKEPDVKNTALAYIKERGFN
jgi:hypothetical protein